MSRGANGMPYMPAAKKTAKDKPEASAEVKPYVVFARRFRPQTFADVAGQSAVTSALRQGLLSGRVAQAYLLCGPRGVGKTSLARIFAKACNCLNGTGPGGMADEPCNTCSACTSIQDGSSLDVIEMDAATNRGIEEVRSLRDNVSIAPAELRYKVYIIDEVHMLTREAWNAFLKTLEEPPAHVKFIFATTDPNDVPETILSRCQRFDLKRISLADIVKRLRKICEIDNVAFEEAALSRIAGLAKGGLRDAEGLLDQAVNLGGGKITDAIVRELSGAAPDELLFDMLKACAAGKTADVLAMAHSALEAGSDPDDMLSVLSERLRSTLLARVCGVDSPLLEGQTHLKDAYAELGKLLNDEQCLMLIQIFTNARRLMRDSAQTRLPLEVALIRAARARDLVDLSKLASALEAGAAKAPQSGAPPCRAPTSGEAPRPNWAGRPATVNTQPAAEKQEVGDRRQETVGRVSGEPSVTSSRDSSSGSQNTPTEATSFASSPDAMSAWPRVIDAIKSQRGGAILASALSHAVVAVDLDGALVALGSEHQFYRDALTHPQNQLALKNALAEIYGCDLAIRIESAANIRPSASQNTSAANKNVARDAVPTRGAGVPPAQSSAQRPMSAAPLARTAPRPPPAPNTPAPWEPQDGDVRDDASDEYVDDGELPLPAPIAPTGADAAPLPADDADDDAPGAPRRIDPPPPPDRARPAEAKVLLDTSLVADHPLVQAILKSTGGVVLEVARSKKK